MSVRRTAAIVTGTALLLGAPAAATAANAAPARPAHHAHHAATKFVATGGSTRLQLDAGTAKVLTDNGVSVSLASEARMKPSGIAFPITGGVLNAKTLAGRIRHSGGLTFTAGGKSLTVRDFTINTVTKRLTAYVDQAHARIPLLDLHLGKAKVHATAKSLSVRNVKATLDKAAASALNAYYGVSLFKSGLPIGTAQVSAKGFLTK